MDQHGTCNVNILEIGEQQKYITVVPSIVTVSTLTCKHIICDNINGYVDFNRSAHCICSAYF